MNKCSACSNPVGPNAVTCPNCGEPTFNPTEEVIYEKYVNKHFSKKDVFAIGCLVFAAGLYLFDKYLNILFFLGLSMMLLGPIVIVYSFLLDE